MSAVDYPVALRYNSTLCGRYIIQDVLGQGSFGITYRALDYRNNNKQVAIKEYYPAALAIRKENRFVFPSGTKQKTYFDLGKKWFLREISTLSAVKGNPNIVRIYGFFEENNTAYFVMEYIEGITLTRHVKNRGGRISWPETWELLLPVMDALTAVHSRNIIHRDLKPDNILIIGFSRSKVVDFGAARYSYGLESNSLDVILTQGYAPMEQYYRNGKQGPWTDVYGIGATMYSSITGRIPPQAPQRIYKDTLESPDSLGVSIPPYAQDALLKALSVKPADRFGSMEEFKTSIPRDSAEAGGPEITVLKRMLEQQKHEQQWYLRQDDHWRRQQEEEEAERRRRQQEEEEAERRRRQQEEEEAERRRRQQELEEAARRQQELEEAECRRRQQELEEAERRRRQQELEEAERRRRQQDRQEKIILFVCITVLVIVILLFALRH